MRGLTGLLPVSLLSEGGVPLPIHAPRLRQPLPILVDLGDGPHGFIEGLYEPVPQVLQRPALLVGGAGDAGRVMDAGVVAGLRFL